MDNKIKNRIVRLVMIAGLNTAHDYDGINSEEDILLYLDALIDHYESFPVELPVKLANGVTKLPKQEPRMETGNIQFGNDWVGLFLRGDDCAGYSGSFEMILRDPYLNPLARIHLRELLTLLQNTKESRLST